MLNQNHLFILYYKPPKTLYERTTFNVLIIIFFKYFQRDLKKNE